MGINAVLSGNLRFLNLAELLQLLGSNNSTGGSADYQQIHLRTRHRFLCQGQPGTRLK